MYRYIFHTWSIIIIYIWAWNYRCLNTRPNLPGRKNKKQEELASRIPAIFRQENRQTPCRYAVFWCNMWHFIFVHTTLSETLPLINIYVYNELCKRLTPVSKIVLLDSGSRGILWAQDSICWLHCESPNLSLMCMGFIMGIVFANDASRTGGIPWNSITCHYLAF